MVKLHQQQQFVDILEDIFLDEGFKIKHTATTGGEHITFVDSFQFGNIPQAKRQHLLATRLGATIPFCKGRAAKEVIAADVDVLVKEKTVEQGPDRNHDELAILAFNFHIKGVIVKAYGVSLYKKYLKCDCNDEHGHVKSCVEIYTKGDKCERIFDPFYDEEVLAAKKAIMDI